MLLATLVVVAFETLRIHSPISTNTFPLGFVPWKVPYRDSINSLSYPSVFWLSLPNGKQARKMRRNDENEIQIANFLSLSLWHDYPLLKALDVSPRSCEALSVHLFSPLLLHHFSLAVDFPLALSGLRVVVIIIGVCFNNPEYHITSGEFILPCSHLCKTLYSFIKPSSNDFIWVGHLFPLSILADSVYYTCYRCGNRS